MDRSALFTELTQRNALRKLTQLPLLDLRVEMDKAVALDNLRRYEALCEAHSEDRQRIQDEVLAERRAIRGDAYKPSGTFGHVGFQHEVTRRFRIFLKNGGFL